MESNYLPDQGPDKAQREKNWQAAKGLQAVDGLETSTYLSQVAGKHIDGSISAYEASALIDSYYETQQAREENRGYEEADKVAARINEVLSETGFTLSLEEMLGIHRRLFEGILTDAGQIRTRNFIKHEWVLDGDTVTYGNAYGLSSTVETILRSERFTQFRQLDEEETVTHIALFASRLWQAHPFSEGNTRTTAVFVIKYLRTLGLEVDNALFEAHSRYFRDALVRSNYQNIRKGIYRTNSFLIAFFENLLLGAAHPLKSRALNVRAEEANLSDMVSDKIVSFIQQDPSITRKKIAEHLGVSVKTIERQLKKMPNVHYEGPAKGGQWIIE